MRFLGTWFRGGFGSAGLMFALNDRKGLFQTKMVLKEDFPIYEHTRAHD